MNSISSRDPVLLSLKDEVATLTINRPRKQNALNLRTIDTLLLMLRALEVDGDVKALIIEGTGEHFCAGEDRDGNAASGGMPSDGFRQAAEELVTALRLFPKLVICKVRGSAHGLGLELVAAADIAIATKEATFAAAAPSDGAAPLSLATFNALLSPKKAVGFVFAGDVMGAAEAERIGLLTRLVDAAELDAHVEAVARRAVGRYAPDLGRWKQLGQQIQSRKGAQLPPAPRTPRPARTAPPARAAASRPSRLESDGRPLVMESMPLDE